MEIDDKISKQNTDLLHLDLFDIPNDPLKTYVHKMRTREQQISEREAFKPEFVMITSQEQFDEERKNRLSGDMLFLEQEIEIDVQKEVLHLDGQKYNLIQADNIRTFLKDDILKIWNYDRERVPLLSVYRENNSKVLKENFPNPLGYLKHIYGVGFEISLSKTTKETIIWKPYKYKKYDDDDDDTLKYVMYMIHNGSIIGTYDGTIENEISTSSMIQIHPKYRGFGLCFDLAKNTYCSLVKDHRLKSIEILIATRHERGACKCYISAAKECGLRIIKKDAAGDGIDIDITDEDHVNYCNFVMDTSKHTDFEFVKPTKKLQFCWADDKHANNHDIVKDLNQKLSTLLKPDVTVQFRTVTKEKVDINTTLLVGMFHKDEIPRLRFAKHQILIVFYTDENDKPSYALDMPYWPFLISENKLQNYEEYLKFLSVEIFDLPNDPIKIEQRTMTKEERSKRKADLRLEFKMVSSKEEFDQLSEEWFVRQQNQIDVQFLRIGEKKIDLVSTDGILSVVYKYDDFKVLTKMDDRLKPYNEPEYRFTQNVKPLPNLLGYLYHTKGIRPEMEKRTISYTPPRDFPEPEYVDNYQSSYIMYMIHADRIIGYYQGSIYKTDDKKLFSGNSNVKISPFYAGIGLCYDIAEKTYCTLVSKKGLDHISILIAANHRKGACRCYISAAKKCGLRIFHEIDQEYIDITDREHNSYCQSEFDPINTIFEFRKPQESKKKEKRVLFCWVREEPTLISLLRQTEKELVITPEEETNLVKDLEQRLSNMIGTTHVKIDIIDQNDIDENTPTTLVVGIIKGDIYLLMDKIKRLRIKHLIIVGFYTDQKFVKPKFSTIKISSDKHQIMDNEHNTINLNLLSINIFDNPNDEPMLNIQWKDRSAEEIRERERKLALTKDGIEFKMCTSLEFDEYERFMETIDDLDGHYKEWIDYVTVPHYEKDIKLSQVDGKRFLPEASARKLIDADILPNFIDPTSDVERKFPNTLGYIIQKFPDLNFAVKEKATMHSFYIDKLGKKQAQRDNYNYVMYMVLTIDGKKHIIGSYSGKVKIEDKILKSISSSIEIDAAYRNLGLCYRLAEETYCTLSNMHQLLEIRIIIAATHPKGACKCYIAAAKKCGLQIYHHNKNITETVTKDYCENNFQPNISPHFQFLQPLEKAVDQTLLSDIGIVTERDPKKLPNFEQLLNVYIPNLDANTYYLHGDDLKGVREFARKYKLLFYIPDSSLQKTYLKRGYDDALEKLLEFLYENNSKLENIIGLAYRDIKEKERTGRIRYRDLKLKLEYGDMNVPFREVYYKVGPNNQYAFIHKMNTDTYKKMRKMIGRYVDEYKYYISNVPSLREKLYDFDFTKKHFKLTTFEVQVKTQCSNKGIVQWYGELSKGQYGVVYDALYKNGNKVVVKVEMLKDPELSDWDETSVWENEVMYQKRAEGIAPKILDSWCCPMVDDDNQIIKDTKIGFVVMERINGETMDDYIVSRLLSGKPLDVGEMDTLMDKFIDALHKLYILDIDHSDSHGKNVMLETIQDSNDYNLKFLDFGFATSVKTTLKRIVRDEVESINEQYELGYEEDDISKFIKKFSQEYYEEVKEERQQNISIFEKMKKESYCK